MNKENVTKKKYPPILKGYCLDADHVQNYRKASKLMTMRLDLNYECNLNCKYCYSKNYKKINEETLSYTEITNLIKQAKSLGLQNLVILGGEPLMYPNLIDLLCFLNELTITPVIFTNTLNLTKELSRLLYRLNVSIVTKLDGMRDSQEMLTGHDTYEKFIDNLDLLLKSGYKNSDGKILRIGTACVVCKQNISDVPNIWRYLRRKKVFPNVEIATLTGSAKKGMIVNKAQVKKLFENLRSIDEEEFSYTWRVPYTPIPCYSCHMFYVGCYVNAYGELSLCSEMNTFDSIRKRSLEEILTSERVKNLRFIEKHLQGKCSICNHHMYCCGCRSKSYYDSNSYYAEDIYCYI
jgi:MoaA/NifB/PqqE/SkfB family radical SAM enzyme